MRHERERVVSRQTLPPTTERPPGCLNCGETLRGEFCWRCGQHAINLRRPVRQLLSDVVGEGLSLDTRLLRTVRPLLFRPGILIRDYVAGHRVRHVPPVKTYLIAALIFFGLFTIFPSRTPVSVVTEGTPEAAATKNRGGSRITFDLPERAPFFDRQFQAASARAKATPDAFASAVFANVPRLFFLFLPVFALLLELLYRREGYYLDHLIFALYFHAFVFLDLALLFLVRQSQSWLPTPVSVTVSILLIAWLFVYLPLALWRVYGGSKRKTLLKLVALGVLYLPVFLFGLALLTMGTLATF